MLKKANRLVSGYEFNKVRRFGNKYTTRYFHIFWLQPRNYSGPTKIGIVVSNKFHKSAVKRNRVRRVFREVVQHSLPQIKDNLWLVLHPKFFTIDKGYEEINSEFIAVLQKIPVTK